MRNQIAKALLKSPLHAWRVRQIIAMDWYDGPEAGFCELDNPGCSLYFEAISQHWVEGAPGERLYALSQIDQNAVHRFLDAHGLVAAPRSPCWASPGKHKDDEQRKRVEYVVRDILASAVPLSIAVQSCDLVSISGVWLIGSSDARLDQ